MSINTIIITVGGISNEKKLKIYQQTLTSIVCNKVFKDALTSSNGHDSESLSTVGKCEASKSRDFWSPLVDQLSSVVFIVSK